jgi:hypothetical protein
LCPRSFQTYPIRSPRGTFGDVDVERSPGDGGDGLHSLALQQMLLL